MLQPRIKRTIAIQEATNSLHMKFTMVTGTHVLFSIWDTRVDDFAAFANSTNFEPQEELMEELIYGSIKRR